MSFQLPFTKITEIPIGPINIQVWGLLVALGMLVGLWVAIKECDRLKVKRDVVYDLFLMIVIGSMIGGRLMYVALFWEKFAGDPLQIFKVWEGGMVLYGGIAGAVIPMAVYLWWKKVSFWKIADILAPGYAIGTFFGRMGCYLIGDHIGSPMGCNCVWGSYFPGETQRRHEPSLYLSLNGLLMFLFLWWMRKRVTQPGQLTFWMFIWEGVSRFFLDFFRANDLAGYSDPRFDGLTISQISALALLAIGVVGLARPPIKKLLSVFVLSVMVWPSVATAAFSDVSDSHEHAAAITWWEERSVVQGYEDGTFLPDNPVNRAEALKMVLLARGMTASSSSEETPNHLYSDVGVEDWFYPYVLTASELGWIQGYEDGSFGPEQTVNLAEALKMVGLAWEVSGAAPSEAPYPDVPTDVWFAAYAAHAKSEHFVLAASDGLLHGETALSRGDLAELLYRFSYTESLGLEFFPTGLNWPVVQHTTADVAMKVPFDWLTVTTDDGTMVLWHSDGTNPLTGWTRPTSLTAVVTVRVEDNAEGLSTSTYFSELQTVMDAQGYEDLVVTQNNSLAAEDTPALLFEYATEDFTFRDLYFELPEGKFAILHATYGNGLLKEQFAEIVATVEQSVFYAPNSGTTSSEDPDVVLEQVRAGLQVDGQGQALLDLFPDLELIETDALGVGTGPVDYYYSAWANVTLKYERSFDVILDLSEGSTTAF